jgi:hypothetical protein
MGDNEFRVWKIPHFIDHSTNPNPTFEHIAPYFTRFTANRLDIMGAS